MASQAAEHQGLDFTVLQPIIGPRDGAEQVEPGLGVGRRCADPLMAVQPADDQRLFADDRGGQCGVGGEPERGRSHRIARVPLHPVAVSGSLPIQRRGLREACGIAPHSRNPAGRLGDEVLQIAFPTAVVVAQKQQLAGSGQDDPPRGMDRADAGQEPAAHHPQADETADRMESDRQRQSPDRGGTQPGQAHHVIMNHPRRVLARHHSRQLLRIGGGIERGVGGFIAHKQADENKDRHCGQQQGRGDPGQQRGHPGCPALSEENGGKDVREPDYHRQNLPRFPQRLADPAQVDGAPLDREPRRVAGFDERQLRPRSFERVPQIVRQGLAQFAIDQLEDRLRPEPRIRRALLVDEFGRSGHDSIVAEDCRHGQPRQAVERQSANLARPVQGIGCDSARMAQQQRHNLTLAGDPGNHRQHRQQIRRKRAGERADTAVDGAIDGRFDQQVWTSPRFFGRNGVNAGEMDGTLGLEPGGNLIVCRIAQRFDRTLDVGESKPGPFGAIGKRDDDGDEGLLGAHSEYTFWSRRRT